MSGDEYNKNSLDAVISRIEVWMKDSADFRKEVREFIDVTNDRLRSIETERIRVGGMAAGITIAIITLWELFKEKLFKL